VDAVSCWRSAPRFRVMCHMKLPYIFIALIEVESCNLFTTGMLKLPLCLEIIKSSKKQNMPFFSFSFLVCGLPQDLISLSVDSMVLERIDNIMSYLRLGTTAKVHKKKKRDKDSQGGYPSPSSPALAPCPRPQPFAPCSRPLPSLHLRLFPSVPCHQTFSPPPSPFPSLPSPPCSPGLGLIPPKPPPPPARPSFSGAPAVVSATPEPPHTRKRLWATATLTPPPPSVTSTAPGAGAGAGGGQGGLCRAPRPPRRQLEGQGRRREEDIFAEAGKDYVVTRKEDAAGGMRGHASMGEAGPFSEPSGVRDGGAAPVPLPPPPPPPPDMRPAPS